MALQIAIPTSRVGVGFPAAYARVVTIAFQRQRGGGTTFMIDAQVFAQNPAGDDDLQEVNFLRYHGKLADLPPGGNPVNRAYDYLKTLPEFGGSVDV